MARPKTDRSPLFRDPADWARQWGWISRRRAHNIAARLDNLAERIEGALSDEGGDAWAAELRRISKKMTPAVPIRKVRRGPPQD